MNIKIYQDSGYIDIESIVKTQYPFIFITGGRATGKTYTSLKYATENNIKFIYMRRTQSQADLINKSDFSPFKSYNRDTGVNIITEPITKYNSAFYYGEMAEKSDKLKPSGNPIGYTAALSTIANMRGFDASDVELLIYDEFIKEKHERPLKNEALAFFNAYESINRNRELKGGKPLQALCLSNAMSIDNDIYRHLKLVDVVDRMQKKQHSYWVDEERGILVIQLHKSPISVWKSKTALYKLTEGSDFYDMAISNDFAFEEKGNIKPQPLIEYIPKVRVGEITIYLHKSNRRVYVTKHLSGTPQKEYGTGEMEKERFRKAYFFLWSDYMCGDIWFDSYESELEFRIAFGKN